MTVLNLDEANRRIEELEGKLAHALEVGGARGRLLAEAEAERNLLREQTRGRGEIIEALTKYGHNCEHPKCQHERTRIDEHSKSGRGEP